MNHSDSVLFLFHVMSTESLAGMLKSAKFSFLQVISRYEKEFGARNYQFSVGKVKFIVVDAQTLDGKYIYNAYHILGC